MNSHRAVQPLVARPALAGYFLIAFTLFGAAVDAAQTPRPRIAARIDDSMRVALSGSVPHLAADDLGDAPEAAVLHHVTLSLRRSPQQQAALDRYLDELRDKSSPNYQKWLTPDEFGRRFGASGADIETIGAWLESEGVTSIVVPKGRFSIDFAGTVAQIERTFQTSIHSFKNDRAEFVANVSEPTIPAALAHVVAGIANLNTMAPDQDIHAGTAGRYDPATNRLVAVDPNESESGPQPLYTGPHSGKTWLFITPADAATMYNTPNKNLNANFKSGTSYDGTGVTIGVIGYAEFTSTERSGVPTYTDIVNNWRSLFLPAADKLKLTITNAPGDTTTNGGTESFAAIEVSGGIAPAAQIHYYGSYPSILPAIAQALDDNTADVLDIGLSMCEEAVGNTDNQMIEGYFQQAAAAGIAVVVSAGDSGSARCDTNGLQEASEGLAVNGLASTAYDVAVGGTDTWGLVDNFSEYVEPIGSDSKTDYYRTLIKPVPESVWNSSQSTPAPISTAVVSEPTTSAGGGGKSSCVVQTDSGSKVTCNKGYAKPGWQAGAGVPRDGVRDLPDVALISGGMSDGSQFVECSPDLGDCTPEAERGFAFTGTFGTANSASVFAGILALVEQKTGKRLGQVAPELYSLFNSSNGPMIFNDITLGNNAPPCELSSPDCIKNKAGYSLENGYNSGAGYDLASGLGSVDATNLIKYWGAALLESATVTVKPAESSLWRGDSLKVAVTVSGSGGTPTGKVKLSGAGYASAEVALVGGKAEFTIPANVLAAGADTLTATYSGDSKFGQATGSAKVTISQLAPTVTVTPAAATVARANTLKVTVKVAASSGAPAGTVTLSSGSYKSKPIVLAGGKATIAIPANALAAGTDTLTAKYSGSPDYKAASGHATVKVTQ